MITEDTLFILGAGASSPYGYPTGKGLRRIICKEFPKDYSALLKRRASPDSDYFGDDAIYAAQNLSEFFFKSSTPSIDLFLARNHNFSDIGRKAIALSIWKAESNSCFREDVDQSQDWYSYLYHRLTETLSEPDNYKLIGQNKVSFITFNYDRSLEFFLYESILNSFTSITRTQPPKADFLPFSFQHVYGQLAPLPWQGSSSLDYTEKLNDYKLKQIYENIRVIYDRTDDNLTEMKEQISKAKRIFFLGFGFANENLEVLGISDFLNGDQQIFGTAYGMTEKEIQSIRIKLNRNFTIKDPRLSNPVIKNMNCYDLLREYL